MMKKHKTLVRGLAGAMSVSALALGLAGTVHAAAGGTGSGFLFAAAASGVQGQTLVAATTVQAQLGGSSTTVFYNSHAGGNNTGIGSGILMGGAAGPFAPSSSINITYSRHNLGTGNMIASNHTTNILATNNTNGGANAVVGTNQICVFCHTPHGFNTVQSGPLWNKQVNSSAAYTVYNAGSNNSSTLDANAPAIGSVSLACLSCHDGTQAMDNMINAPGSGGMAVSYDATLAASGQASGIGNGNSTGVSQGYIWGDSAAGFSMMSQGSSFAPNGDAPAKEGIDLGTDLSNDHPISVQYCGGGISSTAQASATLGQAATVAAGTCADRLFNLPTVQYISGAPRFWVDTNVIPDQDAIDANAASTGGAGANPITRDPNTIEFYVTDGTTAATGNVNAHTGTVGGGCGTGTNGDACGRGFIPLIAGASSVNGNQVGGFGVRTKQDIMLFTNNKSVNTNGQTMDGPSVECASCHDPHTPNNGTFLRVSNNQSGLCLSCHVK